MFRFLKERFSGLLEWLEFGGAWLVAGVLLAVGIMLPVVARIAGWK